MACPIYEDKEKVDAFNFYFRLEKRSLKAVSIKFNRAYSTIKTWSSKFNWPARVAERDHKVEIRTDEKIVENISEMNARHVEQAIALQKFSMKRIRRKGGTYRDGILGLKEGVAMERIGRGKETGPAGKIDIFIAINDRVKEARENERTIDEIKQKESELYKARELKKDRVIDVTAEAIVIGEKTPTQIHKINEIVDALNQPDKEKNGSA